LAILWGHVPVRALEQTPVQTFAVVSADNAQADGQEDGNATDTQVDYQRDVKPLLRSRCVACHGPITREAGLRLDAAKLILDGGDGGPVLGAGSSDRSPLIERVRSREEGHRMPPKGAALTEREIAILSGWIDAGMPSPEDEAIASTPEDHWAFQPIAAVEIPVVDDRSWPRNSIDHFVLAKLDRRGWRPNPPAAQSALMRRVYLDLTGLPPTIAQQDAYLATADGYEDLVAELLDSPAYGERYARHWLDVVRYADSNGYERDAAKPEVWKYRDYVIRALNDDLPFNEFVLQQVAGDEIDGGGADAILATGFHRLGPWDDEPADVVADRFDQLDDLVNTTGQAFLGLTIGCARCHDHKFDPLSQRDYYRMVAVVSPMVRPREGRTELTLPVLSPAERRALPKEDWAALPQGYFLDEPASPPEPTHLLVRGNPHQPAEEVQPGVPEILGGGTYSFLSPGEQTSRRRLSLARWLVSDKNPLTARVIVNRVWQWHFGEGLVRTPNDFGFNGQPPTHPELLDHLAWWFVHDAEWSLKKLHHLIVTSNTYRQSRDDRQECSAVDPENRLLWRRSFQRLEVEPIRDGMLAVSGKLDTTLYGPPIYPLIPAEALQGHSDKESIWPTYDERAAARRTVYAFTKRSLLVPMLEVLDLCDTTQSSAKRNVTTVPTQALTLYNSDFVMRQSRHLADRLRAEAGDDWGAQIELAWRLAFCRRPTPDELAEMLRFVATETKHLRSLADDTVTDAEIDAAARVQLCRVVFNLNEWVYPD
jgi:mono/diheme cytochrome c family protein